MPCACPPLLGPAHAYVYAYMHHMSMHSMCTPPLSSVRHRRRRRPACRPPRSRSPRAISRRHRAPHGAVYRTHPPLYLLGVHMHTRASITTCTGLYAHVYTHCAKEGERGLRAEAALASPHSLAYSFLSHGLPSTEACCQPTSHATPHMWQHPRVSGSSDLDGGRRPKLKSEELSEPPPLFIEIY